MMCQSQVEAKHDASLFSENRKPTVNKKTINSCMLYHCIEGIENNDQNKFSQIAKELLKVVYCECIHGPVGSRNLLFDCEGMW